jgi:hypothetical protein
MVGLSKIFYQSTFTGFDRLAKSHFLESLETFQDEGHGLCMLNFSLREEVTTLEYQVRNSSFSQTF